MEEHILSCHGPVKLRKKTTVPKAEKTFREVSITLAAGVVYPLNFNDTRPNHIVIANGSGSAVTVGRSANVSATVFEYSVAAGKRFQCVFGVGQTTINLFCASGVTIQVLSYEADLSPVAMALANQ